MSPSSGRKEAGASSSWGYVPCGQARRLALGLMGDQPGAEKVQDAIGELDLAIRDVRNVVFDLRQPDPLS